MVKDNSPCSVSVALRKLNPIHRKVLSNKKKKKLINNSAVNLQWVEEMSGRNKASFQQTYCFLISDFILQSKTWILSDIMFHMQV